MAKGAQAQEAVYSRKELMAGAAAFGVRPEVVAGAMAAAGKSEMTKSEMAAAIAAFLRRRV